MSIEDKIFEDLKAAMKAKDSLKVGTLRMVRAQFLADALILTSNR